MVRPQRESMEAGLIRPAWSERALMAFLPAAVPVILVDGSDALAAEAFVGAGQFRGLSLEPAGRIDCLVIDNDLKVKVASCGVSRRPYTANGMAG